MGVVKSKLMCYPCSPRCACCLPGKSDSYDLRDLPRPPRLETGNLSAATHDGVLSIKSVDMCLETNGEDHHTGKFELMTREESPCLVVRRGQAFKLDITLDRQFDPTRDAVSFIFYVADVEKHGPSDVTSAAVPLLEKGTETFGYWSATYEGQMGTRLMVAVTPSADCVVAAWKMDVDTKLIGGTSLSYTHPQPIYVLFNPWCLKDTVYMPGNSHRMEYVEETGGLMYQGVYSNVRECPWNYALYEKDVLECAVYLISKVGKVNGKARGDPVKVVRALSAAINSNDDDGVLVGNWSKDFSDGTLPTVWVGSMDILQKFYKKKKPVKYAQCWVFAGTLTTVCRALGIPCRPVTGYSAAHDSEGSLTIDLIVDAKGEKVEEFIRDSIWNYHVWNEVWMGRPDLGDEYGGWQAVDATPQERSDDMFRCGPAALRAVRSGEVLRPYDSGYVFAQVNADKIMWKYSGEVEPLKLIKRDIVSIGKNISTKAIGTTEREDITYIYKYPERTQEERSTMEKALRKSQSIFARYYLNEVFNDVQFDLELRDDIMIGQDFNVVLHIRNASSALQHAVRGALRVDSVTYTGAPGRDVARRDFALELDPEKKDVVSLLVKFDDYFKKLVDQASFNVTCIATIVDTDFDYMAQDDFRVRYPKIQITTSGDAVSRQELTVTAKVENPLPIDLRDGTFYIQGPGLDKQLTIKLKKSVPPGAEASAEFQLTPPWAGRHQISAKFSSKEIPAVSGFYTFTASVPGTTILTGLISDNNESNVI